MRLGLWPGLLVLSTAYAASQVTFSSVASIPSQQNETRASLHLSALQATEYTTLSHPTFPGHRVRVKKSAFCDPTVKLVINRPTMNVWLTLVDIVSILAIWTSTKGPSISSSTFSRAAGILTKVCALGSSWNAY